MNEEDVLYQINECGQDAYSLLYAADPKLIKRFEKIDKSLIKLLDDVREHFPDAQYYTASGGFNLILGSSHARDRHQSGQVELVAVSGQASIGDGDF